MTLLLPPGVVFLAGVDEVGRGPLAGDVVTAAVILDPARPIDGLADSKVLSEKKRELLYELIIEHAAAFCIARASVAEIDQINILNATLLAMTRAVEGLPVQPDFVAVDGNRLPKWHYSAQAIVKGDSTVPAISAAAIIAKVTRDREMKALDDLYPGYDFGVHKGYGTARHLAALSGLGPSPVHRRSFKPVRDAMIRNPATP